MKCTKCGNEDCFDVPFIGKPKCVKCGADYEADTGNEYESVSSVEKKPNI